MLHEQKKFYFYPYNHVTKASLKNELIIGAQEMTWRWPLSGRPACRRGEIDPPLIQIGRELHPDHPYQSPRVTAHVADGREYLQDTSRHYDLILFALPDSLTAIAGQSASG